VGSLLGLEDSKKIISDKARPAEVTQQQQGKAAQAKMKELVEDSSNCKKVEASLQDEQTINIELKEELEYRQGLLKIAESENENNPALKPLLSDLKVIQKMTKQLHDDYSVLENTAFRLEKDVDDLQDRKQRLKFYKANGTDRSSYMIKSVRAAQQDDGPIAFCAVDEESESRRGKSMEPKPKATNNQLQVKITYIKNLLKAAKCEDEKSLRKKLENANKSYEKLIGRIQDLEAKVSALEEERNKLEAEQVKEDAASALLSLKQSAEDEVKEAAVVLLSMKHSAEVEVKHEAAAEGLLSLNPRAESEEETHEAAEALLSLRRQEAG
jgi:hypothetical protein